MKYRSSGSTPRRPGTRRGITYAEVQVALALFGITLAGLGSVVITQLRLIQAIEDRVYVILPHGVDLQLERRLESQGSLVVAGESPGSRDAFQIRAWAWACRLGTTLPTHSVRVSHGPQIDAPTMAILPPTPEGATLRHEIVIEPTDDDDGDDGTLAVTVTVRQGG